ncbi:MAG: hypothetical protein IT455_09485 [Planctomycetes bacterium]|nr:hypothetical protein [Planctomycetota bacterium]
MPAGSGCAGSAGPNLLTARSLPWLGTTCRAEASGVPANSLVLAAFGLGTLSQPLAALLPQGGAGCTLLVTPDVLATIVPQAGVATIDLLIPNAAALIGGVLHEQALPFEFGAPGLLALTSSNALTLTIGTF